MKKGFHRSPDKSVYLRHIARIFRIGIPNILMQSAYTFYILGLNLILSTFSNHAVTALGLYYKWQTFFGSMLSVFTTDSLVIGIGSAGFPIIGVSFLSMVTSLIFPVFFQAVGYSRKSSALTIIRTVVLFVPLGFLFPRFGLGYFWLTFPFTETLTSVSGAVFYNQFLRKNAPAANTRSGAV